MDSGHVLNRSKREWFSTLPACILLVIIVVFSTSSDIHNQVLRLGDSFWPGYYKLRVDPVQPDCNRNVDVEKQLKIQMAAQQEDDGLGLDLFDSEPVDPSKVRASIENAKKECDSKFEAYEAVKDRISPAVRLYRGIELSIADAIAMGQVSQRFILAMLILLCAITATMSRHHIAMRSMVTRMDFVVSSTAQLIANIILTFSTYSFRELSHVEGAIVDPAKSALHDVWLTGFILLTLFSAYNLLNVPKNLKSGGKATHALLAVPLYAAMTLISGSFFFSEGHYAGIGIYLDKLMDQSDIFLGVGLYVWAGMMLKETRLAALVFGLFKPWRMPPELLAFVAVLVAAVPTAYTGASGIFVIATGAVIYHELREVGARRNLALAATAMSGSMGVVLRPCLLVVVIAILNREVTTDQLYGWGLWVFILSSTVFFIVTMTLNRQSKIDLAPASEALPEMWQRFKPLLPYFLSIAGVVLFYRFALDVKLNEFTAARILPIMLFAILAYEHITKPDIEHADGRPADPHPGMECCVRNATNSTTAEIGALLLLIGCSIGIGGVIERSGVMEMFPSSFSSPVTAMFLMVAILVVLGMIMEAFGAIILVSATIANVAYASGIDAVHFWMVTLVAFELGYLSPPVALNHLLTRQVVGEDEMNLADTEDGTFYQRHERVIMPLITMGTVLVIVAFGPFIVGY